MNNRLSLIAHEIVNQLVKGEYELIVQNCENSRLSSSDLRAVIHEYGRRLVRPPTNAYQSLDAVEIHDTAFPTWSLRVPIWTQDEGRSDLTLELLISFDSDKPIVELEDLHVL